MTGRVFEAPKVSEIIGLLQSAVVEYGGVKQPVGDHVRDDRANAAARRADHDEVGTFQRFAAGLLERATNATNYHRRLAVFGEHQVAPQTLDAAQAQSLMESSGYRFPIQGAETLMRFREFVVEPTSSWPQYFLAAESNWESGFEQDRVLELPGVGYMVRDFALSEFSDHFCAPDLHVRRLICRTGLLLHGYGDPDIATSSGDDDYRFLRRLIHKMARESGFPGGREALSPAHIDRTLWYFGQGACGAHPECATCPANHACLTGIWREVHMDSEKVH